MPVYDYQCENPACKHTWESEHKITAEPEKRCPACGQDTAKRLISGRTGFVLQGTGWARDRYTR